MKIETTKGYEDGCACCSGGMTPKYAGEVPEHDRDGCRRFNICSQCGGPIWRSDGAFFEDGEFFEHATFPC